jgi:hypothetical protein
MKNAFGSARTKATQFFYFVANVLKMSISQKEKIEKLTTGSSSYVLN